MLPPYFSGEFHRQVDFFLAFEGQPCLFASLIFEIPMPASKSARSKRVLDESVGEATYDDDVGREAVDKVRKKAASRLKDADLEVVDGFGKYTA